MPPLPPKRQVSCVVFRKPGAGSHMSQPWNGWSHVTTVGWVVTCHNRGMGGHMSQPWNGMCAAGEGVGADLIPPQQFANHLREDQKLGLCS